MAYSVRVKAPAKINLHLKVLAKRQDGFHSLESIFQAVSLYDELEISLTDGRGCRVHCCGMELPEDNTVTKAYQAFCNETAVAKGVDVILDKKIPSGAGLGGGSSDAASFIKALDGMLDSNLSKVQLHEIAAQVGSDVPFFINGGCALVSGRGEVIKTIASRNDLTFVLVFPEVHSSTKEAYSLVDERGVLPDGCPEFAELERMYNLPVSEWKFCNSFTVPLVTRYPKILRAMKDLENNNAEFVEMTGSGSAVFGVFADEESARRAYEQLCKNWNKCYCLFSLGTECN